MGDTDLRLTPYPSPIGLDAIERHDNFQMVDNPTGSRPYHNSQWVRSVSRSYCAFLWSPVLHAFLTERLLRTCAVSNLKKAARQVSHFAMPVPEKPGYII